MAMVRPKDPHLWMGRFVLSRTSDVTCIVTKDGTIIDVKELDKVGECVGSPLAVARALRGDNQKKSDPVEESYMELQDKRVRCHVIVIETDV